MLENRKEKVVKYLSILALAALTPVLLAADPATATPPAPTPSLLVANEELIQEFHKRMSPDEWRIAERRTQGLAWDAIAAELGGTSEACRKQLSRAVDRVSQELGLDEVRHE